VKYLFVFNPNARRYSQRAEGVIVARAAKLLCAQDIAVAHTVPQESDGGRRYAIEDFARHSQDVDCVVAVGGDGTVNIVTSALMRYGVYLHVLLGVIPYGTGNNFVRSFGLTRQSAGALKTIRERCTVPLDIGVINQQYYFVNSSFGFFAYLMPRRVTKSLVGWTYDTLRHIKFSPWSARIRYTDADGRLVELPTQRYIVGALLNTSHYGSILRMAPDAVGDDGLFDVKLVLAAPLKEYPRLFSVILTGNYHLSRKTMVFRARRLEVVPDASCGFETDGDPIPFHQDYQVEVAGSIRLIVPASYQRRREEASWNLAG
jgi:diacylglycerol kinase (ATP)